MNILKEIYCLLGDKSRSLPWMIILFLIVSLIELVGLGLIAPYMLLIISPKSLDQSLFGQLITEVFSSISVDKVVVVMSLMLVGIFTLKTLFAIAINQLIIRFSLKILAKLRSQLMASYQGLDYAEYLKRNSSEYITAVQSYTAQFINGTLINLLRMVSEGIAMVAILILLAYQNGAALLLLVFMLGVLGFVYDRIYRSKVRFYGQESNVNIVLMTKGIQEGITGFKEIRILEKEYYFHQIVHDNAERFSYFSSKTQLIRLMPRYLLELILVLFIVFLVIFTLWSEATLQSLIPTLSLFGFAAIRLIPSTNILINGLTQMRLSRDATTRLYQDLHKQSSSSQAIKKEVKTDLAAENFEALKFNQLCFHYPDASQNALNKVSFSISKGESIGLIGTSGSGKTTLLDIMLGLLEPQKGDIEFNGKPLQQNKDIWRKCVAYLPQEVFLIDNTLRCNVALGVSEDDIDDEQLNKALKQARLTDLVNQLSDGVETILGERGILLSGGQRQRIALARAFYHDRTVLVLDESTSALDHKTEQEIVEEIRQLKGKKTMIVIAHRLTTLRHCDRIYRLESGEIVARGSYESVVGEKHDSG